MEVTSSNCPLFFVPSLMKMINMCMGSDVYLGSNLIINFLQLFGQLLCPAQETEIEKAESLTSNQQTPIEQSPELSMSNGYSLYGPVGANFSRLTERLVFAFLGGYVSMDDLPCLGDLANGIDEFHRTTSSSINSYSESSQVESLDLNGNLHQLSAISMDLDFVSRILEDLRKSVKTSECYQEPVENVSILLDTFDASPTTCSPPEHTSQRTDEIESLPKSFLNANLICNKSVIGILNLDHPTTSLPFQLDNFPGNVFKISNLKFLDFFNFMDSNSDPDTLFKKLAFKLQKIGVNRTTEIQEDALLHHHHDVNSENFESQFHRHHKNLKDVPVSNERLAKSRKNEQINNGNTFVIPKPATLIDYLYGDLEIPQFLDTESSSMQSEDSCCIIGNNGEGATFSVPDPSQLMNFLYGDLESPVFLSSESIEEEVPIYIEYDGNDSKIKVISQSASEESYQCSAMHSSAISETIAGLMTESLCDSNGFTNEMDFERDRISSSSQFEKERFEISDSKLPYHRDIFIVADPSNKYKSEAHTALATEPEDPLPKNPTNFVPTISSLLCKSEDDEENTKTDPPPCIFNTDEPSLMKKNSASNSRENPEIYASSPCAEVSSDFIPSNQYNDYSYSYGTSGLPISSQNGSSFEEENEITPTSSVSVGCDGERISSDSSFFDLSDHDNLLDMYGLRNQEQYTDIGYTCESPSWPGQSKGQTQKQLTLIPNLTDDDTANGTSTAGSSLFHSNTDETSVMNKNWTDEIYEENSETSVSPCYLNQMECSFEDSSRIDADRMDCLPLFYSCSDDFEDSIDHQPLKNDGNNFKFAFPNSSTLRDYLFGSLDSPRFLASELLDGKIDTLDYPSLFGGCEQNDRTEEADLSGKMIFDQCVYDVIQLFDVTSYPFDISDHDELLESYGIDNQDQLLDANWTCDSPTWPGKM